MLLKIANQDGWEIVPTVGRVKYGGPESKKWGFYVNKTNSKRPIEVVVHKDKSDFDGEEFYYPYNDALIIKMADCCCEAENITVSGRSELEVSFLGLGENEVHDENVIFTSWLHDVERGDIYLFNLAYLLNDKGTTIERIS